MKSGVYANKVETKEALLAGIFNVFALIKSRPLAPTTSNTKSQVAKCIKVDNSIFKFLLQEEICR